MRNLAHPVKMDHAELVSKDPAATQKFLEPASGLKFVTMGPEVGQYRMHRPGEGAAAGSIGIREPMSPHGSPGTISYLTVPNIDESSRSVPAAGGKLRREETEVPQVAYLAVDLAPGGVVQGLYPGMPK